MRETDLIKERYSKRNFKYRYSFLNPDIYYKFQERERKLIKLLKRVDKIDFKNLKVLEIGCGSGTNLIELILLGFSAPNLAGVELLEERLNEARERLPSSVELILGDALTVDINKQFDIIYLSTVFSSILDNKFQTELAQKIWKLTKPGGGVLWYDFIYNNPRNPDVRGVTFQTLKKLFPGNEIIKYKITLAPPIARKIVKINRHLYTLLNLLFPLRTHLLCWIQKR